MSAPVFVILSDYLGTSFVRQSDGLVSFYGNTEVTRPTATRWTLAVTGGPVTWSLTSPGAITPVSSTGTTYTFDFVPTVEGDYSFTLEAINGDGTTSKTFTIGVGRQANNNDLGAVGPFDQWVYCKDSGEKVIGPAFIGNVLNLQGGPNPVSAGIELVLNSSGLAAPNFALNVNTGPSDIGYGVCPVGSYSVPVKGINSVSITPPGYVLFTIQFSVIDCGAAPPSDVTEIVANTLVLTDNAAINTPRTNSFSDQVILADGTPQTHLTAISDGGGGGGGGGGTGSGGGQSGSGMGNCIFEFYEMQTPADVEILPTPKRYDQLGPMRFDKIGKVFGFRLRLIMTGTTVTLPWAVYGDDSESDPQLNSIFYQGSLSVRPGIDNVYEVQFPKSVNTDIFRLTLGPTADAFHRYDVFVKVHISGMQGQAKWLPIR